MPNTQLEMFLMILLSPLIAPVGLVKGGVLGVIAAITYCVIALGTFFILFKFLQCRLKIRSILPKIILFFTLGGTGYIILSILTYIGFIIFMPKP